MPERRIITALLNSTAITGYVGTRIYPALAPDSATLPYLTYQRISTTPVNDSTGTTTTQACRLQLDCWAATYGGVKAISKATQTFLNGYSSTAGTTSPAISMTHMQSAIDLPEPVIDGQDVLIHRVSQDYEIWFS